MSELTIVVIQVIKTLKFFCVFLPYHLMLSASVRPLTVFVLYPSHLCMKCSLGISNFLEEVANLSCSVVFLFLCIVALRRLSFFSLLFSGTLHSFGYIFPFFTCLSLTFFSQLFVRLPQTTTSPSWISFSLVDFYHHLLYSITNLCP